MRVIYSATQLLHNPQHEIQVGSPIPIYERPERAEEIAGPWSGTEASPS
jgi:hypothetical protein